MADIQKIYLGTVLVDKLLAGTDLVYEKPVVDTTPPTTTVYPDPTLTYEVGTEFWLEVNEACTTYYTTNGTTPTTSSPIFTEPLVINADTTLKYFSVDTAGNTETVKTTNILINEPVANSWRYIKIEGYGATEAGQETTTRMIEFEAWAGAVNRMNGLADANITWQTPNNSVGISTNTIKDGVKGTATNTYPFWWTATPNANVVIDLGAQYGLTKLNYYGYSISGVQRNNRFKVLASNTNNGTDWTTIWDNSTGQLGLQPLLPSGYEKVF